MHMFIKAIITSLVLFSTAAIADVDNLIKMVPAKLTSADGSSKVCNAATIKDQTCSINSINASGSYILAYTLGDGGCDREWFLIDVDNKTVRNLSNNPSVEMCFSFQMPYFVQTSYDPRDPSLVRVADTGNNKYHDLKIK